MATSAGPERASEVMAVARNHLYCDAELQKEISAWLSSNAAKFVDEIDHAGTGLPLSLVGQWKDFCQIIEKSMEAALRAHDIGEVEFFNLSRRLLATNPLSDDAIFLQLLRKTFTFETFVELMRQEKKEHRKRRARRGSVQADA